MRQFPASPITALIDGKPRYYLGESMACDLTVADLLGLDGLASLAEVNLGYGTSAGDPAFAARLSPRTQLVMLASPQNPAGVTVTEGEVEQMLAAMSRTCPDALLLIDETFREATYGDTPPAASFAGASPRLLTCASAG